MATFQELLTRHALDPARILFLCHRNTRFQASVFVDAMNGDDRFGSFQEIQGNATVVASFRAVGHVAAFVVEPATKTCFFAGMWRTLDTVAVAAPRGTFDGYANTGGDGFRFATKREPAFDTYRARVVVSWPAREWHAHPIDAIEIRETRALASRYVFEATSKTVREEAP